MGSRSPRVDAYIARQQEFARPILDHLRGVVHTTCPDVVEEIKWSCPHFTYKGMFCAMAAFKEHVTFGFWKGSLIRGLAPNSNNGGESMGNFGRITSLEDLPSQKVLTGYVKEAMRLNDEGIGVERRKRAPVAEPKVPKELAAALAKNAKVRTAFAALSASHRREYAEWVGEAKRDETRAKRVAQTLEWVAEGKSRNWKYERK
jgi:uncharacterized protein YdeI (YjbR/CyaY-like superfamily)